MSERPVRMPGSGTFPGSDFKRELLKMLERVIGIEPTTFSLGS